MSKKKLNSIVFIVNIYIFHKIKKKKESINIKKWSFKRPTSALVRNDDDT